MSSLETVCKKMNRAAQSLGFDLPRDIEIYLVEPTQMLAPLVFSAMPEKYAHWSCGKKAEIFNNLMKDGELNPVSFDAFVPSNPARAFILGSLPLSRQICAVARIYGCLDFARQNAIWQARDFSEVWRQMRFHSERIHKFASDPDIGSEKVEELLTIAHSIAPQCSHNVALGDRTSDFLTEIALHGPKLKDWQREILLLVHKEWVWFLPLIETQLMMKGYASFWLLPLIEKMRLSDDLRFDCLTELSRELEMPELGGLNPSLVGYRIYNSVSKKECKGDPLLFRKNITEKMIARENDPSFVKKYLTMETARQSGLFSWGQKGHYGEDERTLEVKELSDASGWEKVRDELAKWLGGNGFPAIRILKNSNLGFKMEHKSDGRPLDREECEQVLGELHQLLHVPIYLNTFTIDSQGNEAPINLSRL